MVTYEDKLRENCNGYYVLYDKEIEELFRDATKEEKESLIGIDVKYQKSDYYNWLITLKDTKAIIGSINANIFQDDSVIFNYAIDNRYTNKGYMTEALDLVINFFLEEVWKIIIWN